ncbi:MAG: hypothetical protein IRY97_03905, partial [Thermomicrobiaceae bacterium]|nr:hypothetical protein [Thermomicrobiaceae bacterium]
MDLGKLVVDRELVDRDGRRCWKVDDLVLELPEPGARPRVVAIVTGPLALSADLPRPLPWLARQLYRLLGLKDPHPVEIPWSQVRAIDVVVHLAIDREAAGLTALD